PVAWLPLLYSSVHWLLLLAIIRKPSPFFQKNECEIIPQCWVKLQWQPAMASVKEAIIVAGRSYEIAADRRGKTAHLTNQIRQSVIRTRRGRTVVVLGLDL